MAAPKFNRGGGILLLALLPGALLAGLFGTLVSLTAAQDAARTSPKFDSVAIDALDPGAWNGVVFLARAFQQPSSFALRIGSRSGNFLDGPDIFKAVGEVGPHAPDGSYCRMAWHQQPLASLITLEWSRINGNTVVGRLTAPPDVQLVMES